MMNYKILFFLIFCIFSCVPKNINTKQVTVNSNTYTAWDTGNVTEMISMFMEATEFNQNIGNWNTSNVTNMSSMFQNAKKFNKNLNEWNISKVTDISLMFKDADSFTIDNISKWDLNGKITTGYFKNLRPNIRRNIINTINK